ncbi:hypothetical protein CVT24_006832 [Panaeolus cyanescens]|uniref:RlpA-like protein double-psi beta-barrel domain-containing protein n=1 Tax=Panaeolus cyanescens TaxID=181874 RepID=A0A409YRY7_9AGAR|nr:hypothetical protein CVT24_006832 [Panaeolus cyanescens]
MLKPTLVSIALLISSFQLPLVAAFTGKVHHYMVPSIPGACGFTNTNAERVAALPTGHLAGGANCGRNIQVTYGGASVVAKVVEYCSACGTNDIDLSQVAFQVLAPLSVGVIHGVNWNFI